VQRICYSFCMVCKNRVKELREARGLKRHELAVELGVDPSTVWRWETGGVELTEETRDRLVAFFDVTKSHLMGWDRIPAGTGEVA
jgi:transcriptional regulator with XRE-family HTH domain